MGFTVFIDFSVRLLANMLDNGAGSAIEARLRLASLILGVGLFLGRKSFFISALW